MATPAILVVDDDAANRAAITAMLAPLGFTVIEADSGRAALRAVLRDDLAAILMDVRMSALDGYETAKLIRRRAQSRFTPIVLLTAAGSDEAKTETAAAYASGAVDLILTPVQPGVLRAKVSAFVDLFGEARELRRSVESITAMNATLRASEARAQAALKGWASGRLRDELTGLPNRTLFTDRMDRLIAFADRAGESRAVLLVDVDGVRQIDPTGGREEALLRAVAQRLGGAMRASDTVGRLGDDSFAILPGGMTNMEAAAAIAWKIRDTFADPFVVTGDAVDVGASIGIALFPQHGRITTDLLGRADAAVRQAKRSDDHLAVFEAGPADPAARRLTRLSQLRDGIARDEMVLHYQPKIDLRAGLRTIGVEALVRWDHPTEGLLMPAQFMPLAERSELVRPLTSWVLNQALRDQRRWSDDGLDLTMAVNISARSLTRHTDLPETVGELTEAWGIAPGRLILELTENAIIDAGVAQVLERLHAMGERLAIDDFGTGHQSLINLQRLTVDEITVDRSLIKQLPSAADAAKMLRSTIELAHSVGLTVVAEGVEDKLTLEMLVADGCDNAQGYFFSRPRPADELTTWLSESQFGAQL